LNLLPSLSTRLRVATRLRGWATAPSFAGRLAFWFAAVGFIPVAIGGAALLVLLYFLITLPALESIERMAPSLITRVYSRDSTLLREFYTERRVWTSLRSVPRTQIQAVLAIEDQAFYRHGGVDLKAIPSALLPALSGRRVRGASTLTQQLTKRVFLSPERSLARKLREILLSVQIERTYTKDEILEFYLNQVYLGAGAYGFASAADRYFSKPLDSLSLSQQALLAGLLQRPESLRPDRHPEQALGRRNLVLGAMAAFGAITRAEAAAAQGDPLGLRPRTAAPAGGDEAEYFVETVRQRMETKWGRGFMDSAGVVVRTTLDLRIQALADSCLTAQVGLVQEKMNLRTMQELQMARRLKTSEAEILRHWDRHWARFDSLFLRKDTTAAGIAEAARRYPEPLRYHKAQGAVVVIENPLGAVRALSGGLDYKESNYNRALQAVRSPGSAFKAIVYSAAVDQGATPAARVDDRAFSLPDPDDSGKTWSPHNLEYDFEGSMTLRRAFYRSRNIPAIQVAMQAGLDTVVAYARRFGLGRPMRAVPALAIGGCDATPFEMTAAFSVFPNAGEWVEPAFVESVRDRNGSAVSMGEPMRRRVLGEPAAWIMTGMLQDVNIRGTAADVWASGFQQPSGGKTGTSNDYCDAWYVGFTKRYTVGVWVGTDDHFPLGPGHTGTDDALPIWLGIMRALHKGLKPQGFDRPPGISDVRVCRLTGRLAQPFCDSVANDFRVSDAALPGGRRLAGYVLAACKPELHAKKTEPPSPAGDGGEAERNSAGFFKRLWKKLKPGP
jgi:penicillin-binding protein 1A